MDLNNHEPILQYYTIVNNTNPDMDTSDLLTLSDDDDKGKVFYLALEQEKLELEDVDVSDSYLPEFGSLEDEQIDSNMKLITTEAGHLFLTTNLDENLTAIQPELLTRVVTENSTSRIQEEEDDDELKSEIEDHSQIDDYREITLEDGTKALIANDLWNKLLENTAVEEESTKKKFTCFYGGCGKKFATNHHLTVHVRSHTGSKPYACSEPICDKAFATNYSLKAHMRTHTGEKPYGCTVCFKHFKTSGDLQKHVRTHTGEKPFKCDVEGCTKSFTTSNIRKVHIRSHTGERPYVCKYENCGKAFASATNYKNHRRIHSGERPYECPVEGCGKKFTEYSSLYKHNSVHIPFKNFKCEFCSTFFKFETTLRLHKKTTHNVIITENGQEYVLSQDDKPNYILGCSSTSDLLDSID